MIIWFQNHPAQNFQGIPMIFQQILLLLRNVYATFLLQLLQFWKKFFLKRYELNLYLWQSSIYCSWHCLFEILWVRYWELSDLFSMPLFWLLYLCFMLKDLLSNTLVTITPFSMSVETFKLPKWLNDIKSFCQCRSHKRHGFNPWVKKIPWRRKWQPTPVPLPGKCHWQRNLVGYSPCGFKEWGTTEHAHTLKLSSLICVVLILWYDVNHDVILSWCNIMIWELDY